jgi:hypothetical protein
LGKAGQRTNARLRDAARRAAYADSDFDLAAWERLKAFHGHRCLNCQATEADSPLTMDHIVPLSRGGTHEERNIQPLCFPCNMRKHAKIIDYLGGYEITDLGVLPREFFRPNVLKIAATVKALGGATAIPGIRVYSRRVSSVRSA